jgi:hypothetical protein
MRGLAGGVLVGLVLAVGASPAVAADPLPAAPIYPANGASIPYLQVGQDLTVNFACPPFIAPPFDTTYGYSGYEVELANRPDLGPDGTLATAFELSHSRGFPTNAAETECKGTFSTFGKYQWPPGTYYWQVIQRPVITVIQAGPVWSFTVANPAPPPPPPPPPSSPNPPNLFMSGRQAATYVRAMIRRETNGRVIGLKRTCSRSSGRAFRCRLKWRIGRSMYSGTAKVFHWTDGTSRWWEYDFRGQRRRLGCTSTCVRSLRW